MRDEDHLFLRCLMVVLTVAGGFLSLLLLAPPPLAGLPDGEAGAAGAPVEASRARWVRTSFSMPSGSPHPAPAPVQTGETVLALAKLLTMETAVAPPTPRVGQDRAPPSAASMWAGPIQQLAMESSGTHESPAARLLEDAFRGDQPSPPPPLGILDLRPPPPLRDAAQAPHREVMPSLKEMAPVEIMVRRPASAAPVAVAPLLSQDVDEDPLPEFRKFLPRAQACITEARRRTGQLVTGKAILRFTVTTSGWVKDARVASGTLHDPDARSCMEEGLAKDRYFEPRSFPVHAERAVIVR